MNVEERANRARELFVAGHNCPQSVLGAFEDILQENGIETQVALRLASPFGGGMGRLREVCGAVSGMLMVLGLVEGYDDPMADESKAALYEHVQQIVGEFREQNGAILCRELLGLPEGPSPAQPEKRTQTYYERRPCAEYVATAARIVAQYLENRD